MRAPSPTSLLLRLHQHLSRSSWGRKQQSQEAIIGLLGLKGILQNSHCMCQGDLQGDRQGQDGILQALQTILQTKLSNSAHNLRGVFPFIEPHQKTHSQHKDTVQVLPVFVDITIMNHYSVSVWLFLPNKQNLGLALYPGVLNKLS